MAKTSIKVVPHYEVQWGTDEFSVCLGGSETHSFLTRDKEQVEDISDTLARLVPEDIIIPPSISSISTTAYSMDWEAYWNIGHYCSGLMIRRVGRDIIFREQRNKDFTIDITNQPSQIQRCWNQRREWERKYGENCN